MERRIERDVDGWPTRPFEDGFDGLRQLASADFSGVVRAGGTWLFFVNGKIVGVFEGDLDDVEDAQGTAHKAPHPSLPLLYAMQATGGETRAKYYTNDTPISEVHDTLSSGSFTGYVELSENVLSGDYFQLYHAGRSMSVAFVGNSGRMITGEDAFERADDEVGIYEVVDVDVDVTDVPTPEGDDAGSAAGAGTATDDGESADDDPATDGNATATEAAGGAGAPDDGTAGRGERAGDSTANRPVDGAEESGDEGGGAATGTAASAGSAAAGTTPADVEEEGDDEQPAATTAESATSSDDGVTEATAGAEEAGTESAAVASTADAETRDAPEASQAGTGARGSATDGAGTVEESSRDAGSSSDRDAGGPSSVPESDRARFESEAAWQEATTVPSLDPDRSEVGEPGGTGRGGGSRRGRRTRSQTESRSGRSKGERSTGSNARNVDDTLEQEVLEREDRIDRLQQRVENLEDEREELGDERDRLADRVESLTEENESLRSEIRQLEREVEELEAVTASASGGADDATSSADGPVSLAPRAALEGTDLFVRYDSKSAPTLEAAHDGSADATAVNQNLRLDVHTQFEEAGATVGGEAFEAFLEDTMAYRFVEWLVRTLPYEVRETGSVGALRDLYDAVPEIDRVEFHGEVARDAVEGEEGPPSETFDVVVRDKMGEALLVANMNDSRDPATGRMIVDLQEAASSVKEHSLALAGAFFVTRSFFEPAALETASEATSGSLLSRDSRKSYVKLSRKQGYHLCLVEARGDDLHLNVPEL